MANTLTGTHEAFCPACGRFVAEVRNGSTGALRLLCRSCGHRCFLSVQPCGQLCVKGLTDHCAGCPLDNRPARGVE